MGTDQDSASPGAGQGTLDAGLLGLVAEIAALDAVALMVRDATGTVLRTSWPEDHGGLELPPSADPADILSRIGAPAGAVVTAVAPVEEGVDALIVGDFVADRGVTMESSARAIDAFAGLLASSIALEGARRRAEDDRARMASLVDAGLSLGRELALDDLLTQIVQSARTVLGARYAALGRPGLHRHGAGPVRHGRADGGAARPRSVPCPAGAASWAC